MNDRDTDEEERSMSDRARRLRLSTLALFLAAAIACGRGEREIVVSGRIEVDFVRVGSRVGGRVEKVNFLEGDIAPAGAAVVELERTEPEAQLAQAQAAAAQAQANLDLLLAGTRAEDIRRAEGVVDARRAELDLRRKGFREEEVREARAQLESARSAHDLAQKELERARTLLATRTIGQSEFDAVQTAYETASAALEVARQRDELFRSGSRPQEIAMAQAQLVQAQADLERLRNGARPEEIAAARAALEAAKANVARLQSLLDETVIRAPLPVMVETLDLEPGDLLQPGQTVAVLNLLETPWVRCYVPANRLGAVHPGKEVTVTVDAYPGETFAGVVRRVSAEAEFTARNVQTTEKRAEQVFEVKVDVPRGGERLRAGMYADVHIARSPSP